MVSVLGRFVPLLGATVALVVFWVSSGELRQHEVRRVSGEMEVALPWFVQVLMTGGDRYLAADIDVVRALVASTQNMDADNYRIQAQLQLDASWLNPGHEDNYYIAAAILPWSGELSAAQKVLANATKGRPFDSLPPFYYAFNRYHFEKDANGGAAWLLEAAKRESVPQRRFALEGMAARWYERGNEPAMAITLVEAMANDARDPAFKRFLLMRVDRLRALDRLTQAAERFAADQGRAVRDLNELVSAGYISGIPDDPFGFGFELGKDGRPVLLNKGKKTKQ